MESSSGHQELNDEQCRIASLQLELELLAKQFEEKSNEIKMLEQDLSDDQATIEESGPSLRNKPRQKVNNNNCIEVNAVQIQNGDSKQNNVGRRTRAKSLIKPTTIEQIVEVPTELQTPRRRGRKPKLVNDNPANTTITTSSSNDNTPNSDQPKKKRGRKPKPKLDQQTEKQKIREKMRERLSMETPAQRRRRLEKIRQRLANETPEQREYRLGLIYKRLANETPEQREHRLAVIHRRLANETPEKKKQRLDKIHQRIANETPEQRERRLNKIRERNQRLRLAKQIVNSAEASSANDRTWIGEQHQ